MSSLFQDKDTNSRANSHQPSSSLRIGQSENCSRGPNPAPPMSVSSFSHHDMPATAASEFQQQSWVLPPRPSDPQSWDTSYLGLCRVCWALIRCRLRPLSAQQPRLRAEMRPQTLGQGVVLLLKPLQWGQEPPNPGDIHIQNPSPHLLHPWEPKLIQQTEESYQIANITSSSPNCQPHGNHL